MTNQTYLPIPLSVMMGSEPGSPFAGDELAHTSYRPTLVIGLAARASPSRASSSAGCGVTFARKSWRHGWRSCWR